MKLLLDITIHLYVEEKIDDDLLLNRFDICGLFAQEEIDLLRKFRTAKLSLECDREITVGRVNQFIYSSLENLDQRVPEDKTIFYINGHDRWNAEDDNAKLIPFAEKYLNYSDNSSLIVEIWVSMNAGAIFEEDGLRYSMHSREAGRHHIPHVHVRDTQYEFDATLSLEDGSILAGSLSSKLLKKAQKRILNNRDFFYDCWQQRTDGFCPDINHHFGFTD